MTPVPDEWKAPVPLANGADEVPLKKCAPLENGVRPPVAIFCAGLVKVAGVGFAKPDEKPPEW